MALEDKAELALPGHHLEVNRMPGHWLLARLGKRVLRPGGLELTRTLIDGIGIAPTDRVVEFAPGLGVTAAMTLALRPATYTAVERDSAATRQVSRLLRRSTDSCIHASAEKTNLPAESATVVYGEAMLSMQTDTDKRRIMAEASRILGTGGRYGIHELCLCPDDVSGVVKSTIETALSSAIHVGARPLTAKEWCGLLEGAGFKVLSVSTAPFRLLEPTRIIRDEGFLGAMRFASRVARDRAARKRLLAMRKVFRKYANHLAGIAIIAEKRESSLLV